MILSGILNKNEKKLFFEPNQAKITAFSDSIFHDGMENIYIGGQLYKTIVFFLFWDENYNEPSCWD